MSKIDIKETRSLFVQVCAGTLAIMLLLNYKDLSDGAVIYRAVLSGLAAGFIWTGNGVLSDVLSARFSWLEAPFRRFLISLAATLAYTFLIWWFVAAAWLAPQKGFDLLRPLRGFEWSDILPTFLITVFISTFMHGRGFLREWKQSVSEAERLKKEQIAARYEALKNQVNPHFLFNSLNVLITLVHKDAGLAEQFVRQLAAVYRYVLDSRELEAIALKDELEALEAYVFLMKIRFGDSFRAHIQVDGKEGRVAPLTLQMLLENALKHNEVSKNRPLSIEIREESGYVAVSNTVQPKTGVGDSSGVGLSNIRARYQFLTDKKIEVAQDAHTFTVKIPIV